MVAIIVTAIMMFVITLIVLGFSEVTRRNQRESLDTQLGTQAYYAAETGVNDVVNLIKGLPVGTDIPENTTCNFTDPVSGTQYPRALQGTRPNADVDNTCLMVDPTPPSLVADDIKPYTDSVQWDVKNAVAGRNFTSLIFSWDSDTSGGCNTSYRTYPPATSWNCSHALLRVDIVAANPPVPTDAAGLASRTSTFYLHPDESGSPLVTVNSLGTPAAYQGACKQALGHCVVALQMNGAASMDEYYVRMTTLYAPAKRVTLIATDAVNNVPLTNGSHFIDGQVLVDSTGRAQDQLKRIQVRIPLSVPNELTPVFGVQSTNTVCKDLWVAQNKEYDTGACQAGWPNL